MEENKNKTALTELFVVTGCCFLGFNFLLRLIDGTNLPFFSWVGAISLLLGVINFAGNSFSESRNNKLS